ncbi:MAG: helix-turn-helix domain-containing protein [Candidatus Wenzhouxiangella sp. M2_3B_020]
MRDVGDRIRRARRVKGWSQERLARSLGVTTSAVGHWERPKGHQPSSENLIEIARHLSVNVEWLAVGRGAMLADDTLEMEAVSLNEEEKALIKRYQGLSSPSRTLLAQIMDALVPLTDTSSRPGSAK